MNRVEHTMIVVYHLSSSPVLSPTPPRPEPPNPTKQKPNLQPISLQFAPNIFANLESIYLAIQGKQPK
jgi:hypothetical protein